MSDSRDPIERPSLPVGFDDSRARERAGDPAGWRFSDPERAAVRRAIGERRDIRRFRPDPLPDALLRRLLEAAHQAPSVGLMQPWRFVVVRSEETKAAMQAVALRERLRQGESFDERTREFLALKLEGIREAPVSLCVCCDRGEDDEEVLGRHTIRDADIYSTCLAIENFWLAARAEGVGVGWVSFYRPEDVQELLGLPARVVPVAWLCVGYPDERPVRPGLEAAGWGKRVPLDELVFAERWGSPLAPRSVPEMLKVAPAVNPAAELPDWWRRLAAGIHPGDPAAVLRVRDASDELVKPSGSLGALETLAEQFGLATGAPPPSALRAGVLVFAADHGIAARGVSLFPSSVSAQVAAAAMRGEAAIGVLARALGAELLVADVGLAGPRPEGVLDRRIAEGSADMSVGPALEPAMLQQAVETGYELATDLTARCDILLVGEIGIGNTTAAAALASALTGSPPRETCGRGTGIDAQMLARKRALVATALAANEPSASEPLECLRRVGGLELAALAGALLGSAAARTPVLLDGFATGVVALAACRAEPALRDYLIAGHRSAEPAHARVLVELGLEPLLDLRLRLGEASGAALALPLVTLTGRLHAEMARFGQAQVDRATKEDA